MVKYHVSNNSHVIVHDEEGFCGQEGAWVDESRYILSQKLGRPLTSEELVHHINGNAMDNRIENLKIVSKKEHGHIFGPNNKKKPHRELCLSTQLLLTKRVIWMREHGDYSAPQL